MWKAAAVALLNEAQQSVANHARLIPHLKSLHSTDPHGVLSFLLQAIDRVLIVDKKEPTVDKMIEFFIAYATFSSEEHPQDDYLMEQVLEHLLERANAKNKYVRSKSMQIIGGIVMGMGEEAEISEELYERIRLMTLQRTRDRVPMVRAQAAAALMRFQIEDDPSDVATNELIRLMTYDSSKEVRQAALFHIQLCKHSFPAILMRSRDVCESVRRVLYQEVFANRITVKALTISQRNSILRDGINDRSPQVVKGCISMMTSWLRFFKNDPIQLLDCLDVESYEDVVVPAMKLLIRTGTTPKPVVDDPLTSEKLLYYRLYLEYLKEVKKEDDMENLLPSVSNFAKVIELTADVGLVNQLLQASVYLDYQDEVGRRAMASLLTNMLLDPKNAEELIPNLHKALRALYTSERDWIDHFRAILDRLSSKLLVDKEHIEEGKVSLIERIGTVKHNLSAVEVLMNDSKSRNDETDFMRYDQQRELMRTDLAKLATELEDLEIREELGWNHVLLLLSEVLKHLKQATYSNYGQLEQLLEVCVLPAIRNPLPSVRCHGFQCLGLFCLLRKNLAQEYAPLFLVALKNDIDALHGICIKALFDMMLVYGLQGLDNTSQEEQPCSQLVTHLLDLIHSEESEIRGLVSEGFSKLMIKSIIISEQILTRLLVAYFNPNNEGDALLRQCLSVFFPSFAAATTSNRLLLVDIFLSSIRVFLGAPKSSPLSQVSILEVAEFFCYLCSKDMHHQASSEENYHDKLVLAIGGEILVRSDTKEVRKLCQTLPLFHVSKQDPDIVQQLKTLIENIRENIEDKMSLKYLDRFETMITGASDAPNATRAEDDQDDASDAEGSEQSKDNPSEAVKEKSNPKSRKPKQQTKLVVSETVGEDAAPKKRSGGKKATNKNAEHDASVPESAKQAKKESMATKPRTKAAKTKSSQESSSSQSENSDDDFQVPKPAKTSRSAAKTTRSESHDSENDHPNPVTKHRTRSSRRAATADVGARSR
eukprot:TRINITY_DN8572_c0_g2_i1.p1 TRINITY_DN8572_c0_g2~~TRINITY_DN8572_c0_g2_i1.p1  ORF type:complete len:993 (+),score=229.17 TRINITY_DN8572_c0_g2_i1:107-3085(+)